jgi:hypothetical protein
MKPTAPSIEPEAGSARAVQSAATALELNRGRLSEVLDESAGGTRPSPFGSLGVLIGTLAGVEDIEAKLRPLAERHPYGVLAAGVAAGGLACLVLPRLAVGLVIPVIWSEARQLVHEGLHAWLSAGGSRRRRGGQV